MKADDAKRQLTQIKNFGHTARKSRGANGNAEFEGQENISRTLCQAVASPSRHIMRTTHVYENRMSANRALMVVEQNIARLIKLRGNPVRAAVIGVVFDN